MDSVDLYCNDAACRFPFVLPLIIDVREGYPCPSASCVRTPDVAL